MKTKNTPLLAVIIPAILLAGCSVSRSLPVFPDAPSREAFEGFRWETVEGGGLKFRAQRSRNLRMTVNAATGEAGLTDGNSFRMKIKLFALPSGRIDDVVATLRRIPGWNGEDSCRFREIPSHRAGVTRYVLEPAGKSAEEFRRLSAREAIPSTCSGWGVGNSGMRYFEVHANRPRLAVFVEIGQELPLFDAQSIVLTGR